MMLLWTQSTAYVTLGELSFANFPRKEGRFLLGIFSGAASAIVKSNSSEIKRKVSLSG